MPTSERSLTAEELALFNNYGAIGMQMIGHAPCNRPDVLVAGVDTYIQRRQHPLKHFLAFMKDADVRQGEAARALGTVWANQVVREFGWEWICMTLGDEEHVVVAAPDRSLVMFAPEYVENCLASKEPDCRVALSVELLRAGAVPKPRPLTYARTMNLVRRARPDAAVRAADASEMEREAMAAHGWDEDCVESIQL